MPLRQVNDAAKLRRLIEAMIMLEGHLSLPVLLRHVVEEACALVGARYGAIGVLDENSKQLAEFLTVGLDEEQERAIGERPSGRGVLGLLIVQPEALRLSSIADHPDSFGFPPHHPKMTSFLGLPIRLRDEVFGNLYLTDKRDGTDFSAEDEALISGLALAAGIAIETARLHSKVRELTLLEDRDRIARDLHDTVIQRLFAIGLSLQGTARLVPQPEVVDRLDAAVRDLDDTIRQLRTAIFDLETSNPPGLRRNVLDVVEDVSSMLDIRPAVSFAGPVDAVVPAATADHLLATLREALTNVARHADARTVSVSVRADEDLCLEVVDDGRGFELASLSTSEIPDHDESEEAPDGGHGLRNMQRRAQQLGGSFEVNRRDGGGTRLVWAVPV